MLTPATRSRTAVCTCSGVACPSSCTASRISWRCGVNRRPRSRSMAAREVADTIRGYAPAVSDRFLVSAAELFGDGVFETVHLQPCRALAARRAPRPAGPLGGVAGVAAPVARGNRGAGRGGGLRSPRGRVTNHGDPGGVARRGRRGQPGGTARTPRRCPPADRRGRPPTAVVPRGSQSLLVRDISPAGAGRRRPGGEDVDLALHRRRHAGGAPGLAGLADRRRAAASSRSPGHRSYPR